MSENRRFPLGEARAIAEALADVLAERGLVVEATGGWAARVLDVNEVARLLGRRRAWVYEHAVELGAFRFGDGPKARLGFDLASIERWKRERRSGASRAAPPPGGNRGRAEAPSRGGQLIPYEPAGGIQAAKRRDGRR